MKITIDTGFQKIELEESEAKWVWAELSKIYGHPAYREPFSAPYPSIIKPGPVTCSHGIATSHPPGHRC